MLSTLVNYNWNFLVFEPLGREYVPPQSPFSNHWMAKYLQKSLLDLCTLWHTLHYTILQSEVGPETPQESTGQLPSILACQLSQHWTWINSDHLTTGLRIKSMISECLRWKIPTCNQGNLSYTSMTEACWMLPFMDSVGVGISFFPLVKSEWWILRNWGILLHWVLSISM